MRRLALLTLVACAGCAETPAPGVPLPAPHRPGAWQQFCEQAWNVPQASALAAARGADGFELVAMYNGVLCYKRPVPDASRPQPSSAAPASSGTLPVFRDPGF